jgi:hypothetical protein
VPAGFIIQAIGPELSEPDITVNSAMATARALSREPGIDRARSRPTQPARSHNLVFTATDNFNPPAARRWCASKVTRVLIGLPHTPGAPCRCGRKPSGHGATIRQHRRCDLIRRRHRFKRRRHIVFTCRVGHNRVEHRPAERHGVPGAVFGRILCIGGNLLRLSQNAVGGSITAPSGGELSVSVSGRAGDVLGVSSVRFRKCTIASDRRFPTIERRDVQYQPGVALIWGQ